MTHGSQDTCGLSSLNWRLATECRGKPRWHIAASAASPPTHCNQHTSLRLLLLLPLLSEASLPGGLLLLVELGGKMRPQLVSRSINSGSSLKLNVRVCNGEEPADAPARPSRKAPFPSCALPKFGSCGSIALESFEVPLLALAAVKLGGSFPANMKSASDASHATTIAGARLDLPRLLVPTPAP